MLCPRIASVSFHAFAGGCVGDDVIRNITDAEDGSGDVTGHIANPS